MEEALTALLLARQQIADVVGSRVYWVQRPQAGPLPAVVMTRVGGRRLLRRTQADGLVESRVQIDAYGETFTSTKEVVAALVTYLNGASFPLSTPSVIQGMFLDAERDLFEGEVPLPLHRISLDFRVWHTEPSS